MITVKEIKEWLNTMNDNDHVGLDEVGPYLRKVENQDVTLEVGGMPEKE